MRLLVVSNRLPFSVLKENENISLKPSSGGLVSGISSYLDYIKNSPISNFEYLWIGWPGAYIEEKLQENFSDEVLIQHNVVPVFVSEEEMDKFYLGFCNSTIWPLFHYFPSYVKFDNDEWNVYKKVNEYFAEKILDVIKDGDVLWIHDYHLMLLPDMIRKKTDKDIKIGFFLHIPFPSFEIYRIMPRLWRQEILDGIMGSDLVGFHTQEYTHSFLRTILRIKGLSHNLGKVEYDNRIVKVDTFPMGIDFDKFYNSTNNEKTIREKNEIKNQLKNLKIILSVDRLDYTKGVLNRLKGFKKFLKSNPDYLGKVVFILIIVPSRIGVDKYQEMKDSLDKMIGEINGEFGNINWQPIIYQYRHIPFENLVALYNLADVALITPLRDGMNLVAKEYIAAKGKEKNGVLILSEMAGAAKELSEALLVNPNDIDEISNSIKIAIEMDNSLKIEKIENMQRRIRDYNVLEWVKDFLSSLDKIKEENKKNEIKIISDDDTKKILKDFQRSQNRLIMLDYDGTLVDFRSLPYTAVPDKDLIDILEKLSKRANLVILSGRKLDFLEKYFGSMDISLSAEHGAFIKEKGGVWNVMSHSDVNWKTELLTIFKHYSNRLPGSYIEEKIFSISFHYRNCDPEMSDIRVKEFMDELINYTSNLNLQILNGNKVFEIRNYEVNKATAAAHFIAKDSFDFIIFIGDDWTDEDVFKLLKDKNAYTIKIGLSSSAAKRNILNISKVRKLLKVLIDE